MKINIINQGSLIFKSLLHTLSKQDDCYSAGRNFLMWRLRFGSIICRLCCVGQVIQHFQPQLQFLNSFVVQLKSRVRLFAIHGLHHARLPCPSPSPGDCSSSYSCNQWCHPTISSSVTLFSSCSQSFPASWSFPVSQLFTSNGQNIGSSASASVLSMNIQDWFSLRLTGLISLLSKVFGLGFGLGLRLGLVLLLGLG